MRIIITGTPGTGKTTIAELLGKKIKHKVVNEKEFCEKKKIGRIDKKTQELVVPIKKFEKEMNKLLARKKNIIVEGHLLCEAKLKADLAIVLRMPPDLLELRLRERRYPEFMIQDNVLCEGIDYCKKHALRNYPNKKVIEIHNKKTIKETMHNILQAIKER
jgi:adenylate kinase